MKRSIASALLIGLIALMLGSAYVIVERNHAATHGAVTEAPAGIMH